MNTWRDVKWECFENDDVGRVIARVDGEIKTVCWVPAGSEQATIARAIAFAWNADLVQAQWARELFSVDDKHAKVRDSARV